MTTYRVAEAAEILGVSDDTLRRWIDAGRIEAEHAGPAAPRPGRRLAQLARSLADTDTDERRAPPR